MVYHSLFDRIMEVDPLLQSVLEKQRYQGTLERVLDETLSALNTDRDESEIISLALHPPRIIRAFVDYKVENPNAREVEYLLKDAIGLALDVYRGEKRAAQKLERLRIRTIKTGNDSILTRELRQKTDTATWEATHPIASIRSAEKLVTEAKREPLLFIALAHGGVAAGMDTYLRYCDLVRTSDSVFYVARFSNHKLGDTYPRLSQTEVSYLQQQSEGRKVVVFDEDRSSGETLDRARSFLENVFPQVKLIAVTNIDKRGETMGSTSGSKLFELNQTLGTRKKKLNLLPELLYCKLLDEKISYNICNITPPHYLIPLGKMENTAISLPNSFDCII